MLSKRDLWIIYYYSIDIVWLCREVWKWMRYLSLSIYIYIWWSVYLLLFFLCFFFFDSFIHWREDRLMRIDILTIKIWSVINIIIERWCMVWYMIVMMNFTLIIVIILTSFVRFIIIYYPILLMVESILLLLFNNLYLTLFLFLSFDSYTLLFLL